MTTVSNQSSNKWDSRFIDLAVYISQWSKDPSTKVGAVIVDSERRVVSLGYNGFPRGVSDREDKYNNRQLKHQIAIHAEKNAILNSHYRPVGCTIYITHPPCAQCAGSIIQSGIVRVVCPVHSSLSNTNVATNGFIDRWHESIQEALSQFTEVGISFNMVNV